MELVKRARESYVGGEQGHPLETDNGTHPTDAIKILDGDVVANEDGSNLARALVGILRTSRGDDVAVMWKAGKPTGLSLRGPCIAQEHTIDAKSPYAAMNPGCIGKRVELRKLRAIEAYDVVFDPSFGTFFAAPEGIAATESVVTDADSAEVKAAAARLRIAGAVIEKEIRMDIKDVKALETAFPELVRELRDAERAIAATEATRAVGDQVAADRVRLVALESANVQTSNDLKAATEALATVRADLARKEIVGEIRRAVEAWQVGKPGAQVVASQVIGQAEAGAFANAEESVKGADSMLKFATDFAVAAKSTPPASAAERSNLSGIRAEESATKRPKTALELLAGTV